MIAAPDALVVAEREPHPFGTAQETDHVTPFFVVSFETVADTDSWPPVLSVTEEGVRDTATAGGADVLAPPPHPATHKTRIGIPRNWVTNRRTALIRLSLQRVRGAESITIQIMSMQNGTRDRPRTIIAANRSPSTRLNRRFLPTFVRYCCQAHFDSNIARRNLTRILEIFRAIKKKNCR